MGEVVRRTVGKRGLVGTLLQPDADGPWPAVVALGGAGGGLSEGGARSLASEGFAALALAYFGTRGLPRDLVEIPLEYLGRAISWLRAQPGVAADRVAVVGNSKGGELALLVAATYPQHVGAVVAYAPSGVVWQGLPLDREAYYGGPRSPWSLRGLPVPFAGVSNTLSPELARAAGSFFEGRPVATRPLYDRALDEGRDIVARIAVGRISAPVLLISGTEDGLWPSTRLAEMVVRRLEAEGHPFGHEHLRYGGAGHMISLPGYVPARSWTQRFELGGSPQADALANTDSWPKVLGFLREHLTG